MNADHYLKQAQALLPRGLAWTRAIGTNLTSLLQAWSDEFARVDATFDTLTDEADPRTTLQLLSDYERVFGLPDPCVTAPQTVDQRRGALVSKMTYSGGQSRAYFIGIANAMGYPAASIDEFSMSTCDSSCDLTLTSLADVFTWRLNLPGSTAGVFYMTCDADCNDAIQSWGDQAIQCRISNYKPAHTNVIFAYP